MLEKAGQLKPPNTVYPGRVPSPMRRKPSDRKKKAKQQILDQFEPTEEHIQVFYPLVQQMLDQHSKLPPQVSQALKEHTELVQSNVDAKEQDWQEMYNIFDQNDRNQDGVLDPAEYNSFMKLY